MINNYHFADDDPRNDVTNELIPHPCKGCPDYDETKDICISNGGCEL